MPAHTVAVMVTVTLTLTPTYTQVGQLPSLAMSELRAELAANPAVAAPAAPLASTHAAGATADATVESAMVRRTLAAFRARLGHAEMDESRMRDPGNHDAERATIKPP